MSHSIKVIICPKDELGYGTPEIREKFNSLSQVLNDHGFGMTRYLDRADIAEGNMPAEHYDALQAKLDQEGFILDTAKTVYAIDR